jgi:hypothetical protein
VDPWDFHEYEYRVFSWIVVISADIRALENLIWVKKSISSTTPFNMTQSVPDRMTGLSIKLAL